MKKLNVLWVFLIMAGVLGFMDFNRPVMSQTASSGGTGGALSALSQKASKDKQQEIENKKKAHFSAIGSLSGVYGTLQKSCEDYSLSVCRALSKPILKLFLILASILLLWKIGIEGVLRKSIDPLGLFKLLFLIAILSSFISKPDVFLEYFYKPLKELTLDTTAIVVQATSVKTISAEKTSGVTPAAETSGSDADIKNLLDQVDKKFATIIIYASDLTNSSYVNMGAILIGILLSIVFYLISFLFLFYVADLYFGLMIVSALGPLFLAAYLFPMTKGYSESALRMAVSCCLTVIFSGLAMGVTVALTTKIATAEMATKVDANTWHLLCVGFLSLLFMRRAPQIASSITGTADSGSSSLMVGAAMTAVSIAKTGTLFGGGKIAGALMGGANAASGGGQGRDPIPMFKDGPAKD